MGYIIHSAKYRGKNSGSHVCSHPWGPVLESPRQQMGYVLWLRMEESERGPWALGTWLGAQSHPLKNTFLLPCAYLPFAWILVACEPVGCTGHLVSLWGQRRSDLWLGLSTVGVSWPWAFYLFFSGYRHVNNAATTQSLCLAFSALICLSVLSPSRTGSARIFTMCTIFIFSSSSYLCGV